MLFSRKKQNFFRKDIYKAIHMNYSIGVPIIYMIVHETGEKIMGRKKLSTTKQHRADYNADYQKAYVKRYVFKLNTKHDRELMHVS
jgi:hypothetical protein